MLITTASIGAVVVIMAGALILWGNPRRSVNVVVFTCSFHLGAWLACLHLAISLAPHGLVWLKWACAVAASLPLHFRAVSEVIVGGVAGRAGTRFWRWLPGWVLVTIALCWLPFSDVFIPPHSTDANRIYGWGYYAYIAVDVSLYAYLFARAFHNVKSLTGARRLELQVWIVGGSSLVIALFGMMALNVITQDRVYIRLQPLLVIGFYACTAYAITAHRIFDARQIMLVGASRLGLVSVIAGGAYLLDSIFSLLLPQLFAFLLTTAAALWLAVVVKSWLDRVFQFYPQATAAREAAFAIARKETRMDELQKAFLALLKGWGQSENAMILFGTKVIEGAGVQLATEGAVVSALRPIRWATPERLARERQSHARLELASFLEKRALGALVIADGPALTVVVAIGHSASRRPYTYPQITQLLELTSIIESALERAHFSVKAQHAEQLATVGLLGASLAHEIRNPLVTIKTFVQLLPKHHQDPAFREKFFGLIGDEVTRIDRLTEQLLDLASPRAYRAQAVELHPVLRTSVELVAAKATDKRIEFLTDFKAAPDEAFTDPSAAKQVLLNLCFNAIQAVESREGERWVKVSTRNVTGGIEMAVEDSGPGIAPEMRPRLFQPFQSSKSSGFGLGLAICNDILTGLDATISVDPSLPGRGAAFRVVFPCPA